MLETARCRSAAAERAGAFAARESLGLPSGTAAERGVGLGHILMIVYG